MTPHHHDRSQMFTWEAIMYDDSNVNKNEFTSIVSFAVNFHFFCAQLMLCGHLSLLSGCLITLPFKWWEKGSDGERKEMEKGLRACMRERQKKRGRERGKGGETERARRRQALIELVIFKAFFLSIVCCGTGIREGGRKKRSSHRFQKVSLPFWQMWCQLCCLIKRKWRWWLQHRRDLIW